MDSRDERLFPELLARVVITVQENSRAEFTQRLWLLTSLVRIFVSCCFSGVVCFDGESGSISKMGAVLLLLGMNSEQGPRKRGIRATHLQ